MNIASTYFVLPMAGAGQAAASAPGHQPGHCRFLAHAQEPWENTRWKLFFPSRENKSF